MSDLIEAVVPTLKFSAGERAGAEAFERWEQRVAGYFDTEPVAAADGTFRVEAMSWHFGKLIATHAEYGARGQLRTAKRARADQIDHYRMILPLSGTTRADADGRRVQLLPGQILITDMARPLRYVAEHGSNLVLIVPRELLDAALPRPLDLHGAVPQGSAARMLSAQLRSLSDQASALLQAESASLSQSLVHMIAASVAPTMDRLADEARHALERTLLRQICHQIDRNLQNESLSPAALATQFQISRATLYRLFEPLGGVAAYIKHKRLSHIHAMLAAPEHRHHLSKLAELYGYSDASTLSRSFKQRFGYRPSEIGQNPAPLVSQAETRVSDLGDWMRTLLR